MNMADTRQQFEAWISAPPFERSTERYPDDPAKYSFPGIYMDYEVHIAWDAWQEARRQADALVSILGDKRLSPAERILLAFYHLRAGSDGKLRMRQEDIAREVCLSTTKINQANAALRMHGLVTTESTWSRGKGGGRSCNTITVL